MDLAQIVQERDRVLTELSTKELGDEDKDKLLGRSIDLWERMVEHEDYDPSLEAVYGRLAGPTNIKERERD